MYRATGSCTLSNLAAPAGVPITGLIPPSLRAFARLLRLRYRCGGTPHTITCLKTLWRTTLAASASASATSITLSADNGPNSPAGALAAGDWLCIELGNGSYFLTSAYAVSSLTATIQGLPAAAPAGNKVWCFGVPGDHVSSQTTVAANPTVGSQFLADAGHNDWSDLSGGICQGLAVDHPLMVHSNNLAVAGRFDVVSAAYTLN